MAEQIDSNIAEAHFMMRASNMSEHTNATFMQNDYYYLEEYLYGYDYEYTNHIYEIFDFETPLYGYVWPVLVMITTCFNLFVIGGFLRKRMRTPTNIILVFIAVSDSLTGLVTLPATFHIFTNHHFLLTKDWCNAAMITRLYISRAFHTVSVWQTLLLGVHRFLQVRWPNLAQKVCTTKKTLIMIFFIYVAAFLVHSFHAFDPKVHEGFCVWRLPAECGWSCAYIWITLLLCHLLPCIALIVLAANMMRALNKLNNNIDMHTGVNRRKERNRKVTLVVVLIVLIFLIPELPYGIFYLMIVTLRHSNKSIFPLRTNRIVHTAYEILLIVSYHLNFWVYCLMIQSFRNLMKQVVRLLSCRPVNFERLQDEGSSLSDRDFELAGMNEENGM